MNTLDCVRKAPIAKSMGMEIEIIAQKRHDAEWCGFWFKGGDGSIRCLWNEYGYEFVSQPLSYEWMHREIKKLYKLFGTLGVYTNSSCGIHIHVSKKWCSEKKAAAIWKFIKSLPIVDYEDFFGRRPNHYCTQVDGVDYDMRYRSINTTNSATTEFRMFDSAVDERWAHYCVDCVKYMVDNAYTLNVSAMTAFRDQPKYRGL